MEVFLRLIPKGSIFCHKGLLRHVVNTRLCACWTLEKSHFPVQLLRCVFWVMKGRVASDSISLFFGFGDCQTCTLFSKKISNAVLSERWTSFFWGGGGVVSNIVWHIIYIIYIYICGVNYYFSVVSFKWRSNDSRLKMCLWRIVHGDIVGQSWDLPDHIWLQGLSEPDKSSW